MMFHCLGVESPLGLLGPAGIDISDGSGTSSSGDLGGWVMVTACLHSDTMHALMFLIKAFND